MTRGWPARYPVVLLAALAVFVCYMDRVVMSITMRGLFSTPSVSANAVHSAQTIQPLGLSLIIAKRSGDTKIRIMVT